MVILDKKPESKPGILDDGHNWIVLTTSAAALVSVVIGVRFVSPILYAAALAPFYHRAMQQQRYDDAISYILRWGVTLLGSLIIIGAFVPGRLATSVMSGANAAGQLQGWLAGAGPPPADFRYLLWGTAALLAASIVSGGMLGLLVAAWSLGYAARGALFLFEHGNNVIAIILTAIPVWQWACFAAGALLLVPASVPFYARIFHVRGDGPGRAFLRMLMIVGGSCFVLSLLLRLMSAGAWRSLLTRVTNL